MATTIDQGFQVLLGSLTPLTGESEAAKKHRASIKECLEKNFGLNSFFQSGSFGNGTSIRGYSDVDFFAGISDEDIPASSTSFLTKVRDALDKRFPNTGVMVRTPAVVVPFGANGGETTEIVPAKYVRKTTSGYRVYEIANGASGWMQSSPEAHKAYIAGVDSGLNGKVKPLIRFIKGWKYFSAVEISSFYLELRCGKYASGEKAILYSIDVHRVLSLLSDNGLASIQDPAGISGYVPACSTDSKKESALAKLEKALYHASKAREAESAGKIEEAFRQWGMVFNGHFPAYG